MPEWLQPAERIAARAALDAMLGWFRTSCDATNPTDLRLLQAGQQIMRGRRVSLAVIEEIAAEVGRGSLLRRQLAVQVALLGRRAARRSA